MGIFDRMGKVISSNVNAMLEKAEDDKKLLELNLEEMGEQLKSGRQDVISAVAASCSARFFWRSASRASASSSLFRASSARFSHFSTSALRSSTFFRSCFSAATAVITS